MDFSSQLKQWANKKNLSMHKAIAMTAIRLGTNIIERTPIDTGRAKGNWLPAYGSADTDTSESRTASEAIAALSVKFTVAEVGRNSSIFITNSLPYVNRLEYGYSKQAPNGMVRLSVAEFREILTREANNAK